MNVLLLTADSLRADRTSMFGHERDTTPFLADFAADAFEFRRAYVNGRNTAASFPAVHTSTHQRYYDGIGIPATGTPTLAESFRDAGHRTHAVHTNELVSRDYNYNRGFNVFDDSRRGPDPDVDGGFSGWRGVARRLIGDGPLFEFAKRAHFASTEYFGVKLFDTADAVSGFEENIRNWTTRTDDDWFIWAHYMNTHHPYEPLAECQEALGMDPVPRREATKLSRKMRLHPEQVTDEERERIRALYDASILSWDWEVESTLESLDEAGELEDTLVIVTADHGELLGEDSHYGHPPVVRQELLRVPLIFSGPVETGQSNRQVSLIDLAPTMLELAGCPIPGQYQGDPLFDHDGGVVTDKQTQIIVETGDDESDLVCAVDNNRKVIYDVTTGSWVFAELQDRQFGEDPVDEHFEDLRLTIQKHLDAARRDREQGANVDESSLQDDLAALGYLDE